MTRRLNMSQCKRFINRTKVNKKACLAEAGKLTLPDQKVESSDRLFVPKISSTVVKSSK